MAATSFVYSRREDPHVLPEVPSAKIVVVDRDQATMDATVAALRPFWPTITGCSNVFELSVAMNKGPRPDLVLLESPAGTDDLEPLALLKQFSPATRVLVLSNSPDTRATARVIRAGAHDCLVRPFSPSQLQQLVSECLTPERSASPYSPQEVPLQDDTAFVFASKKMWEIRAQCSLIAKVDLPVLILGESGTGKEVLANFIHKTSPRAGRTFLKVNCAAVPADLLESELFGFEQGAFTGATRAKPGKFELCNHGTILLDEIGEMPAEMQAKLLQVLQDGTFARLGGRTSINVDVRVIAATNIDIRTAIAQRKFREDLFYRLNGFSITLPPLRERREEIPVLFRYFMRKFAGKYGADALSPSEALLDACVNHPWPGNLRELENFVRRFLVLGSEKAMMAELAPVAPPATRWVPAVAPASGLKKLVRGVKGEAEMQAITVALQNSGWNRKMAAAELKISYKALLYKVRQYGIRFPDGH